MLQVLPILASTAGLEGRALNTDSTDLSGLCFNAQTSTPLTVAQSLRYLQNLLAGQQGKVTDLGTQVALLSSKLSATNQNDIALSLQNFQSVLNQLSAQTTVLQTSVNTSKAVQTLQMVTPMITALGESSVPLLWARPFTNDAYTVACSIEDPTSSLQVASWAYIPGGSGITIAVTNSDHDHVHSGTLHAIAYPA